MICSWSRPPADLGLPKAEIHVWRVFGDNFQSEIRNLEKVLPEDELEQGKRFCFLNDTVRFIVRRGILRLILSCYLKTDPRVLPVVYNEYGKPALFSELNRQKLNFNISHSGELVLLAFTCGRDIGVDVEQVRSDIEFLEIAKRFFSAQENRDLLALPAEQRLEAFYACWTRKEAFIKAKGRGLSIPLDSFDVQVVPNEKPRLLANRGEPKDVEEWSLYHLEPAPNYVGALAFPGAALALCCWDY